MYVCLWVRASWFFESSGGMSCGWINDGCRHNSTGFWFKSVLVFVGWASLGWVGFGLVCCCRSGELMMLPKPDSVWIWPKRVGMQRTWFFLFCFVLNWVCVNFGGSEMNPPIIPRDFTSLYMAPSSFPISNPTSAYHRQAQTSTCTHNPAQCEDFDYFAPNCHDFMLHI